MSGDIVRVVFLLLMIGLLFAVGIWITIVLKGVYRLCGVSSLLAALVLALTVVYEFII